MIMEAGISKYAANGRGHLLTTFQIWGNVLKGSRLREKTVEKDILLVIANGRQEKKTSVIGYAQGSIL